ncbi:MAG: GNAT family N-acetyltransferase, partial [Verrucomicrobiales bacterium]|nr:GNAT family N-acetyltransferase [Verrucomicrobiales bacterium]
MQPSSTPTESIPDRPDENSLLPIAEAGDLDAFRAEVASISDSSVCVQEGKFVVYEIRGADFPLIMHEVAREREIAFRAVGEGTGQAMDRDRFDEHYIQLILWDADEQRLAGGYRVGKTDEILATHGPDGLYCSELFQFEPEFLSVLNPALELGRSFVCPAYQRAIKPLALLWKAVTSICSRDHRYHYVYGPVSISDDYSALSKSLIVEFMNRRLRDDQLASKVKPKNPFSCAGEIDRLEFDQISESLATIEDVSARISESEPDGKGIPVLIRQYLKMKAKLLSFNVDPQFGNTLDALLLADFRQVPLK